MKHFTLRSFLVGLIGLAVITTSSMYVALRLGALPWPTVFVTILSLIIIKNRKDNSINEINVAHTIMSSGAMVAGGLAFTLPGIWFIDKTAEITLLSVFTATVCGALLGTVFSSLFRKGLIEEEKLEFPIGKAAYQTLVNGIKKGREAVKLFVSMAVSVVITALRDAAGLISPAITVFKGNTVFPAVSFWISPMAMAIGAMIGSVAVLLWAVGTLLSLFIITPAGLHFGLFASMTDAESFRQNLGIGLMLGTGVGVLLKAAFDIIRKKNKVVIKTGKINGTAIIAFAALIATICLFLSIFTELTFFQAFLTCIGVFLVTLLSGMLTGQSGINPIEIFGILIMLAVSLVCKLSLSGKFTIAIVTAVSCGLCGDVMNDFKSGFLLKTNPASQIMAEGLGGTIGAFLSVIALFAMKKAFGEFGTEFLPAPQAQAVASMAGGLGNIKVLLIGMAIGIILYFCKINTATLGLGIYLPYNISLTVCAGALISKLIKIIFKTDENTITLTASGLLGGEGITGVVIAITKMVGGLFV